MGFHRGRRTSRLPTALKLPISLKRETVAWASSHISLSGLVWVVRSSSSAENNHWNQQKAYSRCNEAAMTCMTRENGKTRRNSTDEHSGST